MGSPQLFSYLLVMFLLALLNTATTTIAQNDTTSHSKNGDSKDQAGISVIFIIVDVVGLVILVFLFIIYYRKSRELEREMKKKSLIGEEEASVDEKRIDIRSESMGEGEEKAGKLIFMEKELSFELEDLLKASAEGLGKGNFGNCYKAMVDDRPVVVVKRLRDLKPLNREEFEKQLQAMANMKHPNLLPPLAYFYSEQEKFLVYRFLSNGNVYNRLHGGRGTKNRIPFRWNARLSVAQSVARAMEYLHLNPNSSQLDANLLPHGNLKSSNVLLDDNGSTALVSDHALTSLIALPIASQRMVSYKSPEYQNYKKVSRKSDVWSYGSFLLELLTGRVSVHAAPQGVNGAELGSWVHRAVREEWTAEIFDLEILAQRSANHGMLRLLQIAVRCCDKSPEKRPEMSEVVREVENIKLVEDSEDDEEDYSLDRSYTDDSISAAPSMVMSGDEQ